MKITRPLWAKGIFTTPQHFQQQAIWEQHVHDQVARIASPDAWGAVHVALDKPGIERRSPAMHGARPASAGRHADRQRDR
ncbi:hypothetical protein MYA_5200 [Burkholderia sp. KJ006]|nr:hypothetical protein MYA_5200 [Burkholderia sp. KJ006]CAG9188016.1 conserved hypothetical protein [Burkholderia vietnamiensis]